MDYIVLHLKRHLNLLMLVYRQLPSYIHCQRYIHCVNLHTLTVQILLVNHVIGFQEREDQPAVERQDTLVLPSFPCLVVIIITPFAPQAP